VNASKLEYALCNCATLCNVPLMLFCDMFFWKLESLLYVATGWGGLHGYRHITIAHGQSVFSFSDSHSTLVIVFGMCIEYVFAIRHFNFYFLFLVSMCTICTFTTQFSYLYGTLTSQLHNLHVFESPKRLFTDESR
jgi:hypothetical protein